MLQAQFALWFFLLWLSALAVYIQHRATQRGGPYYYLDASTAGENPIQPKYRLRLQEVRKFPRVWEVYNDHRGLPWLIKYLSYGREEARRYFFRDASGKLRYERKSPAGERAP